jgi:hypothetical protein
MSRFSDSEKLAAATRARLPDVAGPWLAAVRREMEKLTTAALAGDVSDDDFRRMAEATSKRLPGLLDRMDHDALAGLMEHGMGAAMANGIAEREFQVSSFKSKEKRVI